MSDRSELKARIARYAVAGIVAANVVLAGIVVAGSASASGSGADDYPSAIAVMTYAMLEDGKNDQVMRIYWDVARSDWVKSQMLEGAYQHCGGEIYEDFSCK